MPLTGVPFAGETIEVTIRAARTAGGTVVREGDAEVDFWAPGREPGTPPPDHTLPAYWSDATKGFTLMTDTSGWAPGTWMYRGRITAPSDNGPVHGMSEFTPLTLR